MRGNAYSAVFQLGLVEDGIRHRWFRQVFFPYSVQRVSKKASAPDRL